MIRWPVSREHRGGVSNVLADVPAMTDAVPGIGHNGSPEATPFDAVQLAVLDLADEARATLTGAVIVTPEQAAAVSALVQRARKIEGAVDNARVAEKSPHLAAGKAVDARYKPLTKDCDRIKESALAALGPWLTALQDKQREEAIEAARIAAEKQAEALASKPDVTDYDNAEAWEAKIKGVQVAVNDAAKAGKARPTASGGDGRAIGLRSVFDASLSDPVAFGKHLWAHYRADYDEWLGGFAKRLADNGARKLPGVTIVERQVAR